ncbi:hypothetical protein AB7M35_003047 [Amorphus suaedae]
MIAIVTTVAACATAKPNFDFARTTLGYRNSGLFNEGRVFFWDTTTNDLIDLNDSVALRHEGSVGPQNLMASNVRGFDVEVQGIQSELLTQRVEADVRAFLANELSFEVKDAVRKTNSNARAALEGKYREIQPDNGYRRWRVRELAKNPARYKLVVITEPVYASSEVISVAGEAGGSVNASIPSLGGGKIAINLKNATAANCSGVNALCFFNVFVAEGSLVASKGEKVLAFQSAGPVSQDKLTQAFRKLI